MLSRLEQKANYHIPLYDYPPGGTNVVAEQRQDVDQIRQIWGNTEIYASPAEYYIGI